MRDKRMVVNPNPRSGIEVKDAEKIRERIFEINKQRERELKKFNYQLQVTGRNASMSQSYITHNLDDLWRDHGVCDLESFERICHFL